ncbi:MAG: hypothetical protein M0R77_13020 [Gammaproteobacteria bacterium]|nr:hypothetical protein [Gammaproteobacteria bacterium]
MKKFGLMLLVVWSCYTTLLSIKFVFFTHVPAYSHSDIDEEIATQNIKKFTMATKQNDKSWACVLSRDLSDYYMSKVDQHNYDVWENNEKKWCADFNALSI